MLAPFPYFGGKRTVTPIIWQALGDVPHYIEPFFGSGAVLLARPDYDPARHTESVCDACGFISNCWRSIQFSPEETAKWCDWPVNHADLCARRKALLRNEARLLENLIADEKWHDPVMAGYWIWAASCWIGSGLTRPNTRPHLADKGMGVHAIGQVPHLGNKGMGVHAIGQRPHLGNKGMGVHAIGQRPHLADKGKGVHAIGQVPHLGNKGKGVHAIGKRPRRTGWGEAGVHKSSNENIYRWFEELSARLRRVRVVCGDWTRVCGGNWQDRMGTVGIFFDPPYGHLATRDPGIYGVDSLDVAGWVSAWAVERGEKPSYRIVLAGYFEEHESLLEKGWTVHRWKSSGGYSLKATGESQGKLNRHREALFFSPHCLKAGNQETVKQGEPLMAQKKLAI